MWFSRIILLSAALLLAAGCGFQPVYGKKSVAGGGDVVAILAGVKVNRIPDREGQILHNYLIDRLKPHHDDARNTYDLTSRVTVSRTSLGVERDESTTRAKLTVSVTFRLKGGGTARIFTLRRVSGFSETEAEYPTLAAEEDALKRSLREIADDLKTRLSLFVRQDLERVAKQ